MQPLEGCPEDFGGGVFQGRCHLAIVCNPFRVGEKWIGALPPGALPPGYRVQPLQGCPKELAGRVPGAMPSGYRVQPLQGCPEDFGGGVFQGRCPRAIVCNPSGLVEGCAGGD